MESERKKLRFRWRVCMVQDQLNVKMDGEVIRKLRLYFSGEIGYHLERKARELISEMEDAPKVFRKEFVVHEEGFYVCYAPGKFMDRKQFDRLTCAVPKDVPLTSELLVRLVNGEVEAWRKEASQKGTWPGKVLSNGKTVFFDSIIKDL